MSYLLISLCALFVSLVAQEMSVTCRCGFYAEDTLQDKAIYGNLSLHTTTADLSACSSTVNRECQVWCASAHDTWWRFFNLESRLDGAGTAWGDIFCTEYGNVIDPAGPGEAIFTKYAVDECGIDWTVTALDQEGDQNLCCERRVVDLVYRSCALPPRF